MKMLLFVCVLSLSQIISFGAKASIQLLSPEMSIDIFSAQSNIGTSEYAVTVCTMENPTILCRTYPLVWSRTLENSMDGYVSVSEFWKVGATPFQVQGEAEKILEGYQLCRFHGNPVSVDCVLNRFSGTMINMMVTPHVFKVDKATTPLFFERMTEAVLVALGQSSNRLNVDLEPPQYASNPTNGSSDGGIPNIVMCPGKMVNDAPPGQPPHIVIVPDPNCKRQ